MNTGMSVIPPGGHKFLQRLPNGNFQLFTATTAQDLINQVTEFRVNNNIDLGNVEEEIKKGISNPSHKYVPHEDRSLRERVTMWKANRAYLPLGFVSQEEAERRAKICVDCPFNKVRYYDDCPECYALIARDLYAMRQGRSTDQDNWIGACDICGHDNLTAVHLNQINLLHKVNYEERLKKEKPDCWLLHLDKEQPKEVE